MLQLQENAMRGLEDKSPARFTYVRPESFVPKNHPLRAIKRMVDDALAGMDELFDSMYASGGRSSIPPEKLLKAQLLMILYSIRGNRQLVEQIHYNFLFRWFLDMTLEEEVWDHSSFCLGDIFAVSLFASSGWLMAALPGTMVVGTLAACALFALFLDQYKRLIFSRLLSPVQ